MDLRLMLTTLHSLQDMRVFAAEIAGSLLGGEILGLEGELGTGKTEFVRGLAEALGSIDPVKSPSFTLLNHYRLNHSTIKHLIHVDLYRLDKLGTGHSTSLMTGRLEGANTNALEHIGLDEWLGQDDVVIVIEWPERLQTSFSKMRTLRFFYGEQESDRAVEFK